MIVGCHISFPAAATEKLFTEATETDSQLKKLFEDAGVRCLHNRGHDVKVVVSCTSMRIYGLALNERDWCYGHRDEANAQMDWHRYNTSSQRFSLNKLLDVPKWDNAEIYGRFHHQP